MDAMLPNGLDLCIRISKVIPLLDYNKSLRMLHRHCCCYDDEPEPSAISKRSGVVD